MVTEAHESDSFWVLLLVPVIQFVWILSAQSILAVFISLKPFKIKSCTHLKFCLPPPHTLKCSPNVIFVDFAYHSVEKMAVMAKWQVATRWILKTSVKYSKSMSTPTSICSLLRILNLGSFLQQTSSTILKMWNTWNKDKVPQENPKIFLIPRSNLVMVYNCPPPKSLLGVQLTGQRRMIPCI